MILKANVADNEYLIGGGSISILNADGTSSGSEPLLIRADFTVPRQLNKQFLAAIDAFNLYQNAKLSKSNEQ